MKYWISEEFIIIHKIFTSTPDWLGKNGDEMGFREWRPICTCRGQRPMIGKKENWSENWEWTLSKTDSTLFIPLRIASFQITFIFWHSFVTYTHALGCRYWSTVRGLGPPNQSIKNISSMSNVKNWKLWPLGQPVHNPKSKNGHCYYS